MPGITIISVGHRPTLEKVHTRRVTMAWRPGGSRIVKDSPIAAFQPASAAEVEKSSLAAAGARSQP